jgi:tetratricopeptide (TPR) repeat protein
LEADIEKDFPDKFRDAEKLLNTNQLTKAEVLVKQINVEEPESARAFYIKGLHLYLSGSLKESHKLFIKALEANGQMEKAIKMEEKSRKLNELFETASKEMIDMNYEKAIELFTKVIEFDKNNNFICQASHFQRALASFNIGQFDAAFEDYKAFESMKKIVGNVLKDIEIPQVSRPKQDEEPKKPKKSKTKKKKEVLPDEFEHDSLCNMLTQDESSSDKSSEVSAGEDEQGKEKSHPEAVEGVPVKTQEV